MAREVILLQECIENQKEVVSGQRSNFTTGIENQKEVVSGQRSNFTTGMY